MNDQAIRSLDALKRITAFGVAHATDFPAASKGGAKFAVIATAVPRLAEVAASQVSGTDAIRAGTTNRAAAHSLVHADLVAINRTAHGLADEAPELGLDKKFRMPRGTGSQALLNAARAFAEDAAPLAAEFTACELPADFLTHLNDDIQALEDAVKAQNTGRGVQAGATAGIDDVLHNALVAARVLGPIVTNKFHNDPATLATWTVASHIERAPRAAKPAVAKTPAGT